MVAAIFWLLPAQTNADSAKVFDIHVSGVEVAEGEGTIRVNEGDDVVLRWHVDHAMEIHLHGYGVKTATTPDSVAETALTARATGRFPITAHGPGGEHVTLTYLEVYPR